MGHNKSISYGEEFQIIYVDALKEMEHNASLFKLVVYIHSDSPKEDNMERKRGKE